jgi:hypothetical protein
MAKTRTDRDASRQAPAVDRQQDRDEPASPPVREEYPGPQESSTGERIDPGSTKPRRQTHDERRGGRQRGAS